MTLMSGCSSVLLTSWFNLTNLQRKAELHRSLSILTNQCWSLMSGGLKEIVPHEKCGYVVQPDPKTIADAIIDYFDNNRKNAFYEMREERKREVFLEQNDRCSYRSLLQMSAQTVD